MEMIKDYSKPSFDQEIFKSAPDAKLKIAASDGILPDEFHATSIFPEYIKIDGDWKLIKKSRMDCCVVVSDGEPYAVEQRNVKKGDLIVLGLLDDSSLGIYLHAKGFISKENGFDDFAFRTSRTRETSYSMDYDSLYELLKYEKDNGYIVWVLGPAVAFDYDSRSAMQKLIENGYVQHILAGNALATHDLEAGYMKTALGQNIYTQESIKNGHYHHLQTINDVRACGSIKSFIKEKNIKDGIMYALEEREIGYILAGSIRDDGPLPETIGDVYESQKKMREIVGNATTVIGLATQLHTIATGNMTPSYVINEGKVRPVNFYTVDITEFAVNKLRDRGSLAVKSIVTNVQDFLVNIANGLAL
jgi:lysine-ketoglutarate reductase/saccharopine dehydrogenase-like protein (TIGR00300 family)